MNHAGCPSTGATANLHRSSDSTDSPLPVETVSSSVNTASRFVHRCRPTTQDQVLNIQSASPQSTRAHSPDLDSSNNKGRRKSKRKANIKSSSRSTIMKNASAKINNCSFYNKLDTSFPLPRTNFSRPLCDFPRSSYSFQRDYECRPPATYGSDNPYRPNYTGGRRYNSYGGNHFGGGFKDGYNTGSSWTPRDNAEMICNKYLNPKSTQRDSYLSSDSYSRDPFSRKCLPCGPPPQYRGSCGYNSCSPDPARRYASCSGDASFCPMLSPCCKTPTKKKGKNKKKRGPKVDNLIMPEKTRPGRPKLRGRGKRSPGKSSSPKSPTLKFDTRRRTQSEPRYGKNVKHYQGGRMSKGASRMESNDSFCKRYLSPASTSTLSHTYTPTQVRCPPWYSHHSPCSAFEPCARLNRTLDPYTSRSPPSCVSLDWKGTKKNAKSGRPFQKSKIPTRIKGKQLYTNKMHTQKKSGAFNKSPCDEIMEKYFGKSNARTSPKKVTVQTKWGTSKRSPNVNMVKHIGRSNNSASGLKETHTITGTSNNSPKADVCKTSQHTSMDNPFRTSPTPGLSKNAPENCEETHTGKANKSKVTKSSTPKNKKSPITGFQIDVTISPKQKTKKPSIASFRNNIHKDSNFSKTPQRNQNIRKQMANNTVNHKKRTEKLKSNVNSTSKYKIPIKNDSLVSKERNDGGSEALFKMNKTHRDGTTRAKSPPYLVASLQSPPVSKMKQPDKPETLCNDSEGQDIAETNTNEFNIVLSIPNDITNVETLSLMKSLSSIIKKRSSSEDRAGKDSKDQEQPHSNNDDVDSVKSPSSLDCSNYSGTKRNSDVKYTERREMNPVHYRMGTRGSVAKTDSDKQSRHSIDCQLNRSANKNLVTNRRRNTNLDNSNIYAPNRNSDTDATYDLDHSTALNSNSKSESGMYTKASLSETQCQKSDLQVSTDDCLCSQEETKNRRSRPNSSRTKAEDFKTVTFTHFKTHKKKAPSNLQSQYDHSEKWADKKMSTHEESYEEYGYEGLDYKDNSHQRKTSQTVDRDIFRERIPSFSHVQHKSSTKKRISKTMGVRLTEQDKYSNNKPYVPNRVNTFLKANLSAQKKAARELSQELMRRNKDSKPDSRHFQTAISEYRAKSPTPSVESEYSDIDIQSLLGKVQGVSGVTIQGVSGVTGCDISVKSDTCVNKSNSYSKPPSPQCPVLTPQLTPAVDKIQFEMITDIVKSKSQACQATSELDVSQKHKRSRDNLTVNHLLPCPHDQTSRVKAERELSRLRELPTVTKSLCKKGGQRSQTQAAACGDGSGTTLHRTNDCNLSYPQNATRIQSKREKRHISNMPRCGVQHRNAINSSRQTVNQAYPDDEVELAICEYSRMDGPLVISSPERFDVTPPVSDDGDDSFCSSLNTSTSTITEMLQHLPLAPNVDDAVANLDEIRHLVCDRGEEKLLECLPGGHGQPFDIPGASKRFRKQAKEYPTVTGKNKDSCVTFENAVRETNGIGTRNSIRKLQSCGYETSKKKYSSRYRHNNTPNQNDRLKKGYIIDNVCNQTRCSTHSGMMKSSDPETNILPADVNAVYSTRQVPTFICQDGENNLSNDYLHLKQETIPAGSDDMEFEAIFQCSDDKSPPDRLRATSIMSRNVKSRPEDMDTKHVSNTTCKERSKIVQGGRSSNEVNNMKDERLMDVKCDVFDKKQNQGQRNEVCPGVRNYMESCQCEDINRQWKKTGESEHGDVLNLIEPNRSESWLEFSVDESPPIKSQQTKSSQENLKHCIALESDAPPYGQPYIDNSGPMLLENMRQNSDNQTIRGPNDSHKMCQNDGFATNGECESNIVNTERSSNYEYSLRNEGSNKHFPKEESDSYHYKRNGLIAKSRSNDTHREHISNRETRSKDRSSCGAVCQNIETPGSGRSEQTYTLTSISSDEFTSEWDYSENCKNNNKDTQSNQQPIPKHFNMIQSQMSRTVKEEKQSKDNENNNNNNTECCCKYDVFIEYTSDIGYRDIGDDKRHIPSKNGTNVFKKWLDFYKRTHKARVVTEDIFRLSKLETRLTSIRAFKKSTTSIFISTS